MIDAQAPMRAQPAPDAPLMTEALMGERVTVYEFSDEGWAWGQLAADGYVGWLPGERAARAAWRADPQGDRAAHAGVSRPLHQAAAGRDAAARKPRCGDAHAGARSRSSPVGFVPARHLAPLDHRERDFVAVAERFLGTPYLWGGKTNNGLDCSGLVQIALNACGVPCPRDSDMIERDEGPANRCRAGAARRSGFLERPHGDRARRSDDRARERVSHGGRDRADCASDRAHCGK